MHTRRRMAEGTLGEVRTVALIRHYEATIQLRSRGVNILYRVQTSSDRYCGCCVVSALNVISAIFRLQNRF